MRRVRPKKKPNMYAITSLQMTMDAGSRNLVGVMVYGHTTRGRPDEARVDVLNDELRLHDNGQQRQVRPAKLQGHGTRADIDDTCYTWENWNL